MSPFATIFIFDTYEDAVLQFTVLFLIVSINAFEIDSETVSDFAVDAPIYINDKTVFLLLSLK